MGFLDRLKQGLTKTRTALTEKVERLIAGAITVDDSFIEELEEILIASDMGMKTVQELMLALRKAINSGNISNVEDIKPWLRQQIVEKMRDDECVHKTDLPQIIIMIGVNGVGKTTSIAKLANYYKNENKKVMIAAADTFRAAAVEQIDIWAKRVGVEIIKHGEGADPAAVVFDAVRAAGARKIDYLIVDTAGRLHNKSNLMDEMRKINRVIERESPNSQKHVMLVIDATTGQNAIIQAKLFAESIPVTGVVLTKLDGTAKGGVAISIKNEMDIPVKWIGIGEKADDLQPFNAIAFAEALI